MQANQQSGLRVFICIYETYCQHTWVHLFMLIQPVRFFLITQNKEDSASKPMEIETYVIDCFGIHFHKYGGCDNCKQRTVYGERKVIN